MSMFRIFIEVFIYVTCIFAALPCIPDLVYSLNASFADVE